jgi:hypothetical protein
LEKTIIDPEIKFDDFIAEIQCEEIIEEYFMIANIHRVESLSGGQA